MLDLSKQHSENNTSNFIKTLLEDNKKPVALLINERYVNIPPPISVPLLESIRYSIIILCLNKMYTFIFFVP